MKWSALRARLTDGELLPSELLDDSHVVDFGFEIIAEWLRQAEGASFYCYFDEGYPDQLRTVWDFPPFVFIKGNEEPLASDGGDLGVCIVGSRKPQRKSINIAHRIAQQLSLEGVTLVSGLAGGIDQEVHRVALNQNTRTVGVIGTGIDRYYPASSKPLQKRMEAGDGMVLSQFIPGSSPTRYSFPMRNATMSAYGQATIIVEASEKSGTRHQARQAVRHGRPLILLNQVAQQTSWGRQLAEDTLVDLCVAETAEQAIELALDIFDRRSSPKVAKAVR